jgi:hypothetical protein
MRTYSYRVISSKANELQKKLNENGVTGFRCVHFQNNPINPDAWTLIFEAELPEPDETS